MCNFTSFLSPLMQAFVSYQQASQRWNESSYGVMLSLFDKHCKKHYPSATELSQEMVDTWCSKRETETYNSCRSRIYPIVSFICYLNKRGKSVVIPPEVPRKTPNEYIPHAFTETELVNFFAVCDAMPDWPKTKERWLNRITYPVFFRLLYSSGIRTNEARLLRRKDADLSHGVLNIRYSKGHAQHYIALHDTMLELLRQYDSVIRIRYPNRTYFFPTVDDGFHKSAWVSRVFRELWRKSNLSHATAYQLRHNYAIENINGWIDAGFEFDTKLLYLSKSMGHSELESTTYYYSLVPGLADILESRTEDVIPEVKF